MRIFVTGASGFIGQHLLPLLIKDKHELLLLERKTVLKPSGTIKTVTGDLGDLDRIKKKIINFDPQICLHLAWGGIPDYGYDQSRQNLDHSMRLIRMLVEETACRKIIVSGSSWEYGKSRGACREEENIVSTSFFTWAKNSIYTAGSLFCRQKNVDFVWLRLFFAFGPGQKRHSLIPMLYHALQHNKTPDIRNPSNAQDFIYISDVAEAFRLAVKKKIKSGLYNIGREKAVSVSDIYRMVQKQMGRKPIPLNQSAMSTSPTVRNWANTSKFRSSVNWCPRVSIEQGIKNHIAFLETT